MTVIPLIIGSFIDTKPAFVLYMYIIWTNWKEKYNYLTFSIWEKTWSNIKINFVLAYSLQLVPERIVYSWHFDWVTVHKERPVLSTILAHSGTNLPFLANSRCHFPRNCLFSPFLDLESPRRFWSAYKQNPKSSLSVFNFNESLSASVWTDPKAIRFLVLVQNV